MLVYLKNSREFEEEADIHAVKLLHDTKISIHGFVNFFKRLSAQDKLADQQSWLSSHPVSNKRITYMKEKLKSEEFTNKRHTMGGNWEIIKKGRRAIR